MLAGWQATCPLGTFYHPMKTPTPFLSIDAHGSLGHTIVARAGRKGTVLQKHPDVTWKTSAARTAYADFLRVLQQYRTHNATWKQYSGMWTGYPPECHNPDTEWATLLRGSFRLHTGNPEPLLYCTWCTADIIVWSPFGLPGLSSLNLSQTFKVHLKETSSQTWSFYPMSEVAPDYVYTLVPTIYGRQYDFFLTVNGIPATPFETQLAI